jgi:hypothetical protein
LLSALSSVLFALCFPAKNPIARLATIKYSLLVTY